MVLKKPIEFEAVDDLPVDVVFLLASAPEGSEYLKILAAVARRTRDEQVMKMLRDADRDCRVFGPGRAAGMSFPTTGSTGGRGSRRLRPKGGAGTDRSCLFKGDRCPRPMVLGSYRFLRRQTEGRVDGGGKPDLRGPSFPPVSAKIPFDLSSLQYVVAAADYRSFGALRRRWASIRRQ